MNNSDDIARTDQVIISGLRPDDPRHGPGAGPGCSVCGNCGEEYAIAKVTIGTAPTGIWCWICRGCIDIARTGGVAGLRQQLTQRTHVLADAARTSSGILLAMLPCETVTIVECDASPPSPEPPDSIGYQN